MGNDKRQTSDEKRPEPKPKVRERPPPSSQAWAIVAPELVVPHRKAN
jgi:hypothetical protein